MPAIVNKTLHSFSSEDPQFPAKNLLETKITKKWKCKDAGEKSCFVVLKLDQPRLITGIDIGNERSGFIEVLVGNSKQDKPEFKEILLATSFMTIVEAKNGLNPHRVRCFSNNMLVESVAKQKWDLVKIVCAQIYNNRLQYGLSFVTINTSETIVDESSPQKPAPVAQKSKTDDSAENRKKIGKFTIRASSESNSDDDRKKKTDKSSPFDRWKASKSGNTPQAETSRNSIKDQVKAKIEQNRKRIRVMTDSSDEEPAKAKSKPDRNRTSGLLYENEDDEPNDKLQKKLDKDRENRDKDRETRDQNRTPKPSSRRNKTPPKSSDQKSSKFASFISDDPPRSSHKPSSSSSSANSKPSSSKSPRSSHQVSRSSHQTSSKSPRSAEKKSSKEVSYKPFHKLLDGVAFVLSGYVNPERGSLRQKALDMGAKYKQDWDSSCTHLICAVSNTPKHQQVKGKGKIVTKRWIEACFSEQKRLPWRRYALDRSEKDEPESEDEIHNASNKPKSPPKSASKSLAFQSDSDDDMVVVDKRIKNRSDKDDKTEKKEDKAEKPGAKSSSQEINEKKAEEDVNLNDSDVQILPEPEPVVIDIDDNDEPNNNIEPASQKTAMDVSTDDELMGEIDLTDIENQLYKGKAFYLNADLPATDLIKLKNQITAMDGRVSERSSKADFIVTKSGHKLPQNVSGEVVTALWVYECHELGALIPTTRYKPNPR